MEEIDNDTNASSVPAVTRRVAYLLALAALILPCGLLIVGAFWIYRYVRGLFQRQAVTTPEATSDQQSAVGLKQDALADS